MKNMFRYNLILLILFSIPVLSQIENNVTFKADISDLKTQGFVVGVNTLTVQGLNWDNGSITVSGDRTMSVDPTNPDIYTVTLQIIAPAGTVIGDSARWKFKGGPDAAFVNSGWESGDPISGYDGHAYHFVSTGSSVTLTAIMPRLQMIQTGLGIQNTVTFVADLSDLLGSGTGYFDPVAGDVMEVKGFWSNPSDTNIKSAVLVSGDPIMHQQSALIPHLYTTTLTLELPVGAVVGNGTGFKYKASPDARFSNTGWETTPNHNYIFQANGTNVTLTKMKPSITALKGPLTSAQKVLFQVNLVPGSANRYNHQLIPRDSIQFAIIKGGTPALGSWKGNWSVADTVAKDSMGVLLNDKGLNGDKVPGDNIWSTTITFPVGTMMGAFAYKYGVWYPSAILANASGQLDNCAPSGQDFSYNLQQSASTLEQLDIWPTTSTDVREISTRVPNSFELEQNYPNPFNPETVIRYSMKKSGLAQLDVYNSLGEHISTLVNQVQNAGTYEAKFSMPNLSSGIYFYTLNADGYRMTKKMLYLK